MTPERALISAICLLIRKQARDRHVKLKDIGLGPLKSAVRFIISWAKSNTLVIRQFEAETEG